MKRLILSISCVLFLTTASTVLADAHFGVGLSDGDKKLTWVERDLSVSEDVTTRYIEDRWEAKEEDISDIDYEAYLKTFKLYVVFKRNF